MTRPALRPPAPRWPRVLREQLRSVGVALRPAMAVAGALQAALVLIAVVTALRDEGRIDVAPEFFAVLPALGALLLPVAVWRGEYDVRRSYLASLPVDRSVHVLTKVAAGWAWLMALTAAFVLVILVLALATGGAVGVDELRVLARNLPAGAPPGEASAYARRWTTPPWQWAVFFTAATVGYLTGSALVLAGSRARRWLAGVAVLAVFLASTTDTGFGLGGVGREIAEGMVAIVQGAHGLGALFGESGATLVDETTVVWDDPLTLGRWALTTLIWVGGAAAGVLLVVGRDRRA